MCNAVAVEYGSGDHVYFKSENELRWDINMIGNLCISEQVTEGEDNWVLLGEFREMEWKMVRFVDADKIV